MTLDDVHEVGRKVLHLDIQHTDFRVEVVKGHDGWNRCDQADSGRDQGVGDVGSDDLYGRFGGPLEFIEGEENTPNGSKQSDEGCR